MEKEDKVKDSAIAPYSASRDLVTLITELNKKIDVLINLNKRILKSNERLLEQQGDVNPVWKPKIVPDTLSLLSLPLALRKTMMTLYKFEKATADDLSQETKRFRAVESQAANQLVRLGYIEKRREGRKVYFYIHGGKTNG